MYENAYDYFMVAISIIIGLALGTLLTKAFSLYNIRDKVTFNWVPAAWALGILLWIIQFWYVGWVVYEFDEWRFSIFLLLLASMIAVYGAAELILPPVDQPNPNMLEHFERTGPAALVFFAGYFVLAFPLNVLVLSAIEEATIVEDATLPAIGAAIILGAARFRGARIRALLAIVFLAFTLFVYSGILLSDA